MPRGWSPPKGGQRICTHCQENVFTSHLHAKLLGALQDGPGSVGVEYRRSSRELYESVLGGCGWCSSLAKGVLRAAHLDYWMERWNDSASDGSELMDGEDGDEHNSMQDGQDSGESPGGNMPQEDGDDSEMEGSDDDMENAGGELTLTLSDLKSGEGELSVQIRFLRGEGSREFTCLESIAGLTWNHSDNGGDCRVRAVGDIRMIFEVFVGPGKSTERRRLFWLLIRARLWIDSASSKIIEPKPPEF